MVDTGYVSYFTLNQLRHGKWWWNFSYSRCEFSFRCGFSSLPLFFWSHWGCPGVIKEHLKWTPLQHIPSISGTFWLKTHFKMQISNLISYSNLSKICGNENEGKTQSAPNSYTATLIKLGGGQVVWMSGQDWAGGGQAPYYWGVGSAHPCPAFWSHLPMIGRLSLLVDALVFRYEKFRIQQDFLPLENVFLLLYLSTRT